MTKCFSKLFECIFPLYFLVNTEKALTFASHHVTQVRVVSTLMCVESDNAIKSIEYGN